MIKKAEIRNILLIYFIIVLIKIVISSLVSSPSIFTDEYLYSKLAQSFSESGSLYIHEHQVVHKYLPLYPAILSVGYVFNNMIHVFLAFKIINAIISSLVIFPIYILGRDFLKPKQALFGAILTSIFVANFNISNYIMAENVFMLLVVLEIFFLYYGFKTHNWKYFFFSGLILALGYWAKASGMILIPVAMIVFFLHRTKIINIIMHYGVALLVALPLIFRNFSVQETAMYAVTGGYGGPLSFLNNTIANPAGYLNWILLYIGYIIIATGFVFAIYYLCGFWVKDKNFKLLFTITFVATTINILVIANQANGSDLLYNSPFFPLFSNRPIGRYLDSSITLVLFLGYISLIKYYFNRKVIAPVALWTSLILFISAQLTIAPLFPVNNQALTLLGVLQSSLEYLFYGEIFLGQSFHMLPFVIIAIILASIALIIYRFNEDKKLMYTLGTAFIILTTISAVTITSVNSNMYWAKSDQTVLGQSFAEYSQGEGSVGIDLGSCKQILGKDNVNEVLCSSKNGWSLFGIWITNDIVILGPGDPITTNYFLTKDPNLPYPMLMQEGQFIIYEIGER